MPIKIAVTHPKTGRTIEVPPEQLPGLKAAGWDDDPTTDTELEDDNADADSAADASVPDRAGDVIDWIGDDPARAVQALDVENARSTPRPTVLDHIRPLIDESQED